MVSHYFSIIRRSLSRECHCLLVLHCFSVNFPGAANCNVLYFSHHRKSKETHHCSEESSGYCVCRRTISVQLSQPCYTVSQVGSAVLVYLSFSYVMLLTVTHIVLVFVWRHMPGHTSREILIILSSLTTCDPANIYELIKVKSQPYPGFHCLQGPLITWWWGL